MALNKKKLMGLLAMLDLLEDEEDPQSTPMPGGILEAMEGRRSGNPRDDMVPLINWQGSQEGWNNFLENWRRGGDAPQAPVAPGADRHPPMPPQNNFSQMPGMPDPFGGVDGQYGMDESSPMPMPEGIEPFNTIPGVMDDRLPRNQMQTLEGDLSMMRQIDPRGYDPMGIANEDRGNPFMETQGVVDPETGQRRVSTPEGQPIPQPNEEVGFMDREISDHGQEMRAIMEAYYSGTDFGPWHQYESQPNSPPEFALDMGLPFSQKNIDNFMAAFLSGDIEHAMKNPTDFVLEEFERKWGWPLDVSSTAYQNPNFAPD